MEKIVTDFGKNLRKLRKQHGLTQAQLAKGINTIYGTTMCHSMVSKWESGYKKTSLDSVAYLADFFRVEITELLK